MTCAYIAFTAQGLALAQQLAAACPGSVTIGPLRSLHKATH